MKEPKGNEIRAKTRMLKGVSILSEYIMKNSDEIFFSIFAQGVVGSFEGYKSDVEDKIGLFLANS